SGPSTAGVGGGVWSTVHEYAVAAVVVDPITARTRNVCEPADSPEYDFVLGRLVPQSANADPSSEHWNFVTVCASVYVNEAEV
ncbi:hypothetical protein, partial [Nocardioides sp.]|uniref:hypothetical protein n=1 Tax=Nocardioides sp. TaxID=35761 RepID=UPI0031FF2C06